MQRNNSFNPHNPSVRINCSKFAWSTHIRMDKPEISHFPLITQYFYLVFSVTLSFLFGWSMEVYLLTSNLVLMNLQ